MTEPEPPIVWESRLVDVRGGVVAAQVSGGDGSKPAVLLLGGATWSRDWWPDALCAELVDAGVRVVRFDPRDTGESTASPVGEPGYDAGDLVSDAVAVMDGFSVDQAVAVGLSMGGGLAQQLAATHPERIAGLVLVSTTAADEVDRSLPGPTPELAATFEEPVPDPDWTDRSAVIDWVVEGERPYAGPGTFDEAQLRDLAGRVWDRTRSMEPAVTNHFIVAGSAAPVDLAPLAALPAVVVHGSADPMFPLPHGEALAAALEAPLVVLDNVGHQAPPPRTWPTLIPAILRVVRDAAADTGATATD